MQEPREVISPQEYERILAGMPFAYQRLFLQIARWTGGKWGEICLLKVEDVYEESPTGRRPRQEIIFRCDPKGVVYRDVPCHPDLFSALEGYQPPESGYLFPGRHGHKPLSFGGADRFFKVALKKAGYAHKFSTHSTRATFIRRLLAVKASPEVIKSLTGLKNLDPYLGEEHSEAIAAILALKFEPCQSDG